MTEESRDRLRIVFEQLRQSAAALPQFLQEQRWYASKSRQADRVELMDGVWLDGGVLLAFARVSYQQGEDETYSLLLEVGPDVKGTRVSAPDRGTELFFAESSSHSAAAAVLLGVLFRGEALPSIAGGSLRAGDEETERLREAVLREEDVKALGAEQSNTSIRVGRDFLFKLFRKLQRGENPELEVSRYLWRKTKFRAMPGLRGWQTMRFVGGDEATVGILQDWVENVGDGWSYVLDALPVGDQEEQLALSRNLHRLGVITAELHWALAGAEMEPGFAPEPVTPNDVSAWIGAHERRAHEVFGQLEPRKKELVSAMGPKWDVFDGGRDLLTSGPSLSCAGDDAFQKIRVHGDFHLGQTLKTTTDFVLFDFEGEPARSLEERRIKTSPLKDVAGMLRSLDYAAAVAHRSNPTRLPDAEGVSERLRSAFLSGYLSNTFEREAPFLPHSRTAVEKWLEFFELEKVVYEIGYELNSRPDWVWIPLQAAARLIERRQGSH